MVHILCLNIKRFVRNTIAREEARARHDIQSIHLNKEAKIGPILDGGDKEFAAWEEFEIDDLEIGHEDILPLELCATGAPCIFHSNGAHDDGFDLTVVRRIVEFERGAELDDRRVDALEESLPDDGLIGEEVEGFARLI